MARKKDNSKALLPDEGQTPARIKAGEVGFSALHMRFGQIREESNTQFQMPNLTKVVQDMGYSPAVSIGLNAINVLMNKAPVVISPVVGEDATDKARREYLISVLEDMEDSWLSTMQRIATFKEWGHQVSEVVLRRRKYENGSKHNDGLVGIRKLAHRPQSSIVKWNFDETGRTLESISQSISSAENQIVFLKQADDNGHLRIPRNKFLLFRAGILSDNPLGSSILKSAYLSYRMLTLLEEHMMTGVSKDTSGIPYAQIDVKYMSADATDSEKAFYTSLQTVLNGLAEGTVKSIILPTLVDPTTGEDKFKLQLLEQKSGKAYDLPLIIRQLQANILSVLSADSIVMGADGGSFSLNDSSTNLLALKVADLLQQIADTLNAELVPLLWRANGWSLDRLPKVMFGESSKVSLEVFSKAMQRLGSTSLMEVTRANLNAIYDIVGFEKRPDDEPVDIESLPAFITGQQSKSGKGMEVGRSGNGTKTNGVDGDENTSDNNADNNG